MNTLQFTKAQRREIRKLTELAYERDLRIALAELRTKFESWDRGELDVFVLNEHIHKFHDGISRDLYKQYVMGRNYELNLGFAIARGIVKQAEVDPAILQTLQNVIKWGRQMASENEKTTLGDSGLDIDNQSEGRA